MSFSVLTRPLQVKESFIAFLFIYLPHADFLIFFSIGWNSSPSRPAKKLKMVKEKKTTSNCRPKKPKLSENVRNSSNLRWSSHKPTHLFDFSNTIDDPLRSKK